MTQLTLQAFPRLHISLLDCAGATSRKYGGIGCTIDGLGTTVKVTTAPSFRVSGLEKAESRTQADIDAAIVRLLGQGVRRNVEVIVTQSAPAHVGLGTKTTATLAALEALNFHHALGCSRNEIQQLSGRGGTSGIGIHAFYLGGFLSDAGQPANSTQSTFAPSSASVAKVIPPVVARSPMPQGWVVDLLLPQARRISGEAERAFFARATPIPRSEALDAIAVAYHGVVPAVLETNIAELAQSVACLHKIGFKRREVENQSPNIQEILQDLWQLPETASGMSSMGPLVYSIRNSADDDTAAHVRTIATESGAKILGTHCFRNNGFELKDHM